MRVVIDMQGAQSPSSKGRGVGRYTKEMVYAFLDYCKNMGGQDDIFLICNSAYLEDYERIQSYFSGVIDPSNILAWQQHLKKVDGMAGKPSNRSAAEILREWYVGQLRPDIVWSTNLQEGWQDNCVTSVKRFLKETLFVSTLHDVIPLMYSDEFLNSRIKDWYLEKIEFAKRSDLLLTVSHFSKEKIVEYLGVDESGVLVAPNGSGSYLVDNYQGEAGPGSEVASRLMGCPFLFYIGGFDKHKNIEFLVKGFSRSIKSLSDNVILVLAGEISEPQKDHFLCLAEKFGCDANKIIFTGRVSDEDLFWLYKSALMFVFPSYSEGFGIPVLEAMTMGTPLLAADAASLPELLNNKSVLFDPYDDADLAQKIILLAADEEFRRVSVSKNRARAELYSWRASAEIIYGKFKEIVNTRCRNVGAANSTDRLYSELTEVGALDFLGTSQSISDSLISIDKPTLYMDISCLVHFDHATGIQRVVRAIMESCIAKPPEGWSIGLVFSYAGHRNFYHVEANGDYLHVPTESELHCNIVDFNFGDIVVFLDLHPGSAISKSGELVRLRSRGVKSAFVVYDLLPVEFPDFFVPELSEEFKEWLSVVASSDLALCISQDVMQKLGEWIHVAGLKCSPGLSLDFFHLGADLAATKPSRGFPANSENILEKIRAKNSFLMVGTVEPRKAHGFVLDAFEILWDQGVDAVLVIVGKAGWKNEATISRLRGHGELGRNLIWLEGISDEYLELVYESSDALISASLGEGFGLPLIEAAQNNLPIIARNIAVFREVAGVNAFYFESEEPSGLAADITKWLELYKGGNHPLSDGMPWLTWDQSAQQFLDKVMVSANSNINKMKMRDTN